MQAHRFVGKEKDSRFCVSIQYIAYDKDIPKKEAADITKGNFIYRRIKSGRIGNNERIITYRSCVSDIKICGRYYGLDKRYPEKRKHRMADIKRTEPDIMITFMYPVSVRTDIYGIIAEGKEKNTADILMHMVLTEHTEVL